LRRRPCPALANVAGERERGAIDSHVRALYLRAPGAKSDLAGSEGKSADRGARLLSRVGR
jgi:hypothetical protein